MLTCIVPGCEKPSTPFAHPACSDEHYAQAVASGRLFQRGVVGSAQETDEQFRERIKASRAAQRNGD